MKAFAAFSERKAGLVGIWARSWSARGWVPKLISEREIEVHGSARAAMRARGGGLLTDLRVINYSYPARKRPARRVVRMGDPGWLTARLVRFEWWATEARVRECGRDLCD